MVTVSLFSQAAVIQIFFFLYIYFVYSFNVAQNYTRDIASTVLISANRHKEKEKLPWFF